MARIVSSVAGTRSEPKDGYAFVRGTTATFKIIFTSEGRPTQVDTLTVPVARILKPVFLSHSGSPIPEVIASLNGVLTGGQEFEYSFTWNIPQNLDPSDEYIVTYEGILGGMTFGFGDEFFAINHSSGVVGTKTPSFATADDVRKKKFNIDDYFPEIFKKDLDSRNKLLEDHLNDAAVRLREELSLHKQRGFSENYRLFCIYYTIWSILLASRGEDGSSVSDQNIQFWRAEWERILSQEKRQSLFQGLPLGRG
jgi:hypothetical protein